MNFFMMFPKQGKPFLFMPLLPILHLNIRAAAAGI